MLPMLEMITVDKYSSCALQDIYFYYGYYSSLCVCMCICFYHSDVWRSAWWGDDDGVKDVTQLYVVKRSSIVCGRLLNVCQKVGRLLNGEELQGRIGMRGGLLVNVSI